MIIEKRTTVEKEPKFVPINFGQPEAPKTVTVVPVIQQPIKEPEVKMIMPPSTVLSVPNFKTKPSGWWIFKAPILIYLLLTFGYAYIGGQALSIYLNNPSILYATLGLHTLVFIMFILLCVVTRRKKE
jgi:hypothetical protein